MAYIAVGTVGTYATGSDVSGLDKDRLAKLVKSGIVKYVKPVVEVKTDTKPAAQK